MNKKITLLFISICFIVLYLGIGYKEGILLQSIFLTFLSILQLSKNLYKIPFKFITLIQMIILFIYNSYLSEKIFLLLPIIFFELVNERFKIHKSMFLLIGFISIFFKYNKVYLSVYSIILLLYLYEMKTREEEIDNLKNIKKNTRKEKFIMEEKTENFNKVLEQNQVLISLRERNIMAQKLHDHLGHRITSSIMQLEVTKETLGKDNEISMKYLLSAMDNLRVGMEEIRKVLRNIKPKEKIVTIEKIKNLLSEFQYSSGIKTHFYLEGEIERLGTKKLIVIEENIKEALTNSLKYSNASQINISIFIYKKIARVEIRDNGKGCNKLTKGLGIVGMEERLEKINGTLRISNDNGFILNMILNLEDLEND